jgi:phosphatidylethanolamine/phosphatidyl-N-methylethanolamine N-methyltransferase
MTTGRDYWERNARRYDASLRVLGQPLPRMLELVGEAVQGSGRVLEVAAGTGLVTPLLARSAEEVVATDYAEAMVRILEQRVREARLGNVQCERADLYELRFEAGSFDAVVAANVLHLVPDLRGALAALRRVLRPGGRIVVPTFCHDETRISWVVSRLLAIQGFPGHRRFTALTFRAALESAGVRVARAETLPGLIPIGYAHGTFQR